LQGWTTGDPICDQISRARLLVDDARFSHAVREHAAEEEPDPETAAAPRRTLIASNPNRPRRLRGWVLRLADR
jgi:hypothetical protein